MHTEHTMQNYVEILVVIKQIYVHFNQYYESSNNKIIDKMISLFLRGPLYYLQLTRRAT